jgi:glycerophosphoryl diester phosphodiesterase
MATKTWKLGEKARGGVITVETTKDKVIVITKDWDFSTGSRKSSNQSNAQELYRKEVRTNDVNAYHTLMYHLNEETHSCYADDIMEWIETKVTFKFNQDF